MTEPHRVLVVEDDTEIRETMIEVLEEAGYHAIGASDGFEALAQLRDPADRWCVVLLDLMMPNMDGWSFRAEQLRDPAREGHGLRLVAEVGAARPGRILQRRRHRDGALRGALAPQVLFGPRQRLQVAGHRAAQAFGTAGGRQVELAQGMGTNIASPGMPPTDPTAWGADRIREALASVQ